MSVSVDNQRFDIDGLPILKPESIPFFEQLYYSLNHKNDYIALRDQLQTLIGADCHAVKANDEVLFNTYQPHTIKENIQIGLIRSELYNHLHSSVLVEFHRAHKPATLSVYMFSEPDSWVVQALYDPQDMSYTIKTYGYKP